MDRQYGWNLRVLPIWSKDPLATLPIAPAAILSGFAEYVVARRARFNILRPVPSYPNVTSTIGLYDSMLGIPCDVALITIVPDPNDSTTGTLRIASVFVGF